MNWSALVIIVLAYYPVYWVGMLLSSLIVAVCELRSTIPLTDGRAVGIGVRVGLCVGTLYAFVAIKVFS